MTLKVLDLFAGQGGASQGYLDAGFELAGAVDLDDRALRRHPRQDVVFWGDWALGLEVALSGEWGPVDFIHASPPCQAFSSATPVASRLNHLDLIEPVREALLATGLPFVIENVPEAPLKDPVYLTGCMFGLTVVWEPPKHKVIRGVTEATGTWEVISGRKVVSGPVIDGPVEFHLERRRGFEAHGFALPVPPVRREIHRLPVMPIIQGTPTSFWDRWYAQIIPVDVKKQLMRTSWMTGTGTAESIPPVYTEYIGKQFTASRS